jgi:hypothetical protein
MGLPIIGLQINHIIHVLLELFFSNILETKCGLLKEVVANGTPRFKHSEHGNVICS